MTTAAQRILAMGLAGSIALTACSNGRSTEAFCSTLSEEQARIAADLERREETANQLDADGEHLLAALSSLGNVGVALGDLATYFERLADVAPEQISADADVVAEEYSEQLDALADSVNDPFGALGTGVMSSLRMAAPLERLDDFARTNCGTGL